jgi:hypothetical protein
MFKSFFDPQPGAPKLDQSLGDSIDSKALFVEIESYESLRAKAEGKDRAVLKLISRVRARDERLQALKDELHERNKLILILKKDLAEVVDENARVKTRCEEVVLERDGFDEVNSQLHSALSQV